jgi:hypothetical protein
LTLRSFGRFLFYLLVMFTSFCTQMYAEYIDIDSANSLLTSTFILNR